MWYGDLISGLFKNKYFVWALAQCYKYSSLSVLRNVDILNLLQIQLHSFLW